MDSVSIVKEIRNRLSGHKVLFDLLGNSIDRPLKSIEDGYPEFALNWIENGLGKIFEYWASQNRIVLSDAFKLDSVVDLLDKYPDYEFVIRLFDSINDKISNEKSNWGNLKVDSVLLIFQDFTELVNWVEKSIESKPSSAEDIPSLILNDSVKNKSIFIIEFLSVLRFKIIKFFEFTPDASYLLFGRKTGVKYEYSEVFISDSVNLLNDLSSEVAQIVQTEYPLSTSFVLTDNYALSSKVSKDVFTLESLISKYLFYDKYYQAISKSKQGLAESRFIPLKGELLSYSSEKQDFVVETVENVETILDDFLQSSRGNLFLLSKPGGGKTSICKTLFRKSSGVGDDSRYSLYLDLSMMDKDEKIEDFITKSTIHYFNLRSNEIFDVIYFLSSRGKILIILDGLDEIFDKVDIDQIISVFGEISKLFTNNSKVVITSRLSFLMSSKHISQLLDKDALVSDKISFKLNSVGVDPLQLPNFKVLKLNEINFANKNNSYKHVRLARMLEVGENDIYISPLEYQIIGLLPSSDISNIYNEKLSDFTKSKLIYQYLKYLLSRSSIRDRDTFNDFIKYFFIAYQNKSTRFNIIELFTYFGKALFIDNVPSLETMLFKELFVWFDENEIKFRHKNYYEFLFSYGFMKGLRLTRKDLSITDEARIYINEISNSKNYFDIIPREEKLDDCIVPKGFYIVGDHDNVSIQELSVDLEFDKHPVSVSAYNEFLNEIKGLNISEFEHPQQPNGFSHEPLRNKLKEKDYYIDSRFKDFPAICISFWSAYAFSRFMGKRLPSSFEWECGSRGRFGNLFSWGNHFDKDIANSADYWASEPLITFDKWREHFDRSGDLRGGKALDKESFPNNISPYGLRNSCGNVWEYTLSVNQVFTKVIICGGSYDNPFRAIKSSSKGIANILTYSNAVGFRCVREVRQ